MSWVELIPLSRCRSNGGTFVTMGDRELAVFRLNDPERVVVIDNSCPHASGNLSGGVVTATSCNVLRTNGSSISIEASVRTPDRPASGDTG
jgi:nitrite reductase/ring-hydroxylating ferredoxin subunit